MGKFAGLSIEQVNVTGFQETRFTLTDSDESGLGDGRQVHIHPWDRDEGFGRGVYVHVTNFPPDGISGYNIIVDRDKFVEGLLAVFPELTKKED